MTMRVLLVAASAVLLLSGCDEGSKKQEEASCKGLTEAACTAKGECSWNADKRKCKTKKQDRMTPDQGTPPAASGETTPPEQSAPPAAEQAPQSGSPAQSEPAPESPQEPPQ